MLKMIPFPRAQQSLLQISSWFCYLFEWLRFVNEKLDKLQASVSNSHKIAYQILFCDLA